jgi:hypothetical protein
VKVFSSGRSGEENKWCIFRPGRSGEGNTLCIFRPGRSGEENTWCIFRPGHSGEENTSCIFRPGHSGEENTRGGSLPAGFATAAGVRRQKAAGFAIDRYALTGNGLLSIFSMINDKFVIRNY